jgi:4-aminobutyrate aminotransferase-like enzyme
MNTDGNKHLDFVWLEFGVQFGALSSRLCKIKWTVHSHVMVYGGTTQQQCSFHCSARRHLPAPLETSYLVNSGTGLSEGAMKLYRRSTGRRGLYAVRRKHYGLLSVMGWSPQKNEPLCQNVDAIAQ